MKCEGCPDDRDADWYLSGGISLDLWRPVCSRCAMHILLHRQGNAGSIYGRIRDLDGNEWS